MWTRSFVICIFSLIYCLLTTIESACLPNVYYNIKSFGENCSYQCHCVNDVQCDAISGECPSGCARGWMGPGCQYRNISPKNVKTRNHPITQISSHFSVNAVDGDLSTCSGTGTIHSQADNWRHYWRIEFGMKFYIVGLMLYIKHADKDLFRGFRVEAGPSSTSFPTLCYEHPDYPRKEVMEVMCTSPVVTRHLRVIFRNPNISLSLCEVDIYGGRHVSFMGITKQSSTYMYIKPDTGVAWNSSKAVDGRPQYDYTYDAYKTCSATTEKINQIHWWQLQLPSTLRIEEIYVYSRMSYEYLFQTAGFSLKILHSGGTTSWIHNDTNINNVTFYLPREVGIVPPIDGKQVRISKARILVLCEVEVFAECLPGQCGWNCNDVCHCSGVTTGNFRMTGVCPYGCEGRWTGLNNRCDHECTDTEWGPYCNNTCGYCHGNQPCDVGNGHCSSGCIVSFQPPLCAETCDDGTFGQNCSSTCGNCTGFGPCDKVTGSCDHGCEPGLQLPYCKLPCKAGTYGNNCSSTCGNCAGGAECDHMTGACPGGCAARGYKPPFCNAACDDSTFGQNCSSTCGFCTGFGPCNKVTGSCDHGCEPGLQLPDCKQSCQLGSYGKNCSLICTDCAGGPLCNHVTGACPGGCAVVGYEPPYCETTCAKGRYGGNCSSTCGNCAEGQSCHHQSGLCEEGCSDGYVGRKCDQVCDQGKYGSNCTFECGYCDKSNCTHTDGTCPFGCQGDYGEPLCQKLKKHSALSVGVVVGGVTGGVVLVAAVGVALIIYRRGQPAKEGKGSQEEETVDNERSTYFEMLRVNEKRNDNSVYDNLDNEH